MKINPSRTYLFDNQSTGRLKFCCGNLPEPKIAWEYLLPNYPPFAPESTPVFDSQGNIYFGSHDNCFYSLTAQGKFRWFFKTSGKIYSSPSIIEKKGIVVASGDGFLYQFDLKGKLCWAQNLCKKISDDFLIKRFQKRQIQKALWDPDRKKSRICKIWASPKVANNGKIIIPGFGKGLHAIDAETGEITWIYDFKKAFYNRSSVAIGPDDEIYTVMDYRFLHCLTPDGIRKWLYDTRLNYESWGGPSVDIEMDTVYFTLSHREKKGAVFSLDLQGKLRWKRKIPGALRGSVTICRDPWVLVAAFNGYLYFLNKSNGNIEKAVQLSSARRALWTTPCVDPEGFIFITTKDDPYSGSVYCLKPNGKIQWRFKTGKALSTPVIDRHGRLYFGSWDGKFICLQT